MIAELQRAIELAQQQPEEEQRQIAALILEELADRAWEASPELAIAIAEAHEQVTQGEVVGFQEYDHVRGIHRPQTR